MERRPQPLPAPPPAITNEAIQLLVLGFDANGPAAQPLGLSGPRSLGAGVHSGGSYAVRAAGDEGPFSEGSDAEPLSSLKRPSRYKSVPPPAGIGQRESTSDAEGTSEGRGLLQMPPKRRDRREKDRPPAVGGAPSPGTAPMGTPSPPPASPSPTAGGHATGASLGEEDDDADEDFTLALACVNSAGPLLSWVSLLLQAVVAAAAALLSLAAFALFPLLMLLPPAAVEALARGAFRVGYLIYTSDLGAWLHAASLRGRRRTPAPHSRGVASTPLSTCEVVPVPILGDNYAYLVIDASSRTAAAVDPSDAAAVIAAARAFGAELTMVLTTHRHHDHAGGNTAMRASLRGLVVIGGRGEGCAGVTREVNDGDILHLGGTRLGCVATPCHTRGHMAYTVLGGGVGATPSPGGATLSPPPPLEAAAAGRLRAAASAVVGGPRPPAAAPSAGADVEAVFSGDTLFVGGCGAFFHGTASDMWDALGRRLGTLPGSALVFPGHEYGVDGLRFAAWVQPGHAPTAAQLAWAELRRARHHPAVPSTMALERTTNPYMRAGDPAYGAIVRRRLRHCQRSRRGAAGTGLWGYLLTPRGGGDTGGAAGTAADRAADGDPSRVMRNLHALIRHYAETDKERQQPPCCVHGTCAVMTTCCGKRWEGGGAEDTAAIGDGPPTTTGTTGGLDGVAPTPTPPTLGAPPPRRGPPSSQPPLVAGPSAAQLGTQVPPTAAPDSGA